MKLSSSTLLACALTLVSTAVVPASEPAATPDGMYSSYLDDAGNEIVDFIPMEQVGNSSFAPIHSVIPAAEVIKRDTAAAAAAVIEKRGKYGCLGASYARPQANIDAANMCIWNNVGDPFTFLGDQNRRTSCVVSGIRSFICSYPKNGAPTSKVKDGLWYTWAYIKLGLCGTGRLGHAEIDGGHVLVSAGYTYDGDKFCW
ncbi:hypothetical protein V8F33_011644 [Rhypophila sp. PSN 637]